MVTISRSQFLVAAGAVVASVTLPGVADASGNLAAAVDVSGASNVVAGTVDSVETPNLLHVRHASGDQVLIQLTAEARIQRQGHDADLAAFVSGDEVVAQGHWAGDRFIADSLASVFRQMEGDVTRVDGTLLETTGGRLLLTPDTWAMHRSGVSTMALSQLRVGDSIAALAWYDPTREVLMAAAVWTPQAS